MYLAAATGYNEPTLNALLADPLIRDVMASDRVTETDLILLISDVAKRRAASGLFAHYSQTRE